MEISCNKIPLLFRANVLNVLREDSTQKTIVSNRGALKRGGFSTSTTEVMCSSLFACLSAPHSPTCPSIRLSVRPPVRPSVRPFIRPSVRPSVHCLSVVDSLFLFTLLVFSLSTVSLNERDVPRDVTPYPHPPPAPRPPPSDRPPPAPAQRRPCATRSAPTWRSSSRYARATASGRPRRRDSATSSPRPGSRCERSAATGWSRCIRTRR